MGLWPSGCECHEGAGIEEDLSDSQEGAGDQFLASRGITHYHILIVRRFAVAHLPKLWHVLRNST